MKSREECDKPSSQTCTRRKHRHYRVTIIYQDGGKFARCWVDIYQYLRLHCDWEPIGLLADKLSFACRDNVGIQAADLWTQR
jgi:hypothetical protein